MSTMHDDAPRQAEPSPSLSHILCPDSRGCCRPFHGQLYLKLPLSSHSPSPKRPSTPLLTLLIGQWTRKEGAVDWSNF